MRYVTLSFRLRAPLNPNSRQMDFFPSCTKVFDDLLFTNLDNFDGVRTTTAYRCIHIPSLMISAQLPNGSLSLTKNAFAALLPKYVIELCATGPAFSIYTSICSIPACPPTHPRYCFIIKRFLQEPQRVEWEVLEVEIDLSIPGPIKIFSRISQQYAVQRPNYSLHDSDDDLLLYLPLGRGGLPRGSLSVQSLRVGKPGKGRLARLGGAGKMASCKLIVDKDAGYVIIWAAEDWPRCSQIRSFIWWLDERKPGNMLYSQAKELVSSWSHRVLRRF